MKFIVVILLGMTLGSCSRGYESERITEVALSDVNLIKDSPSSSESYISSSAAVENLQDTIHKFVRTADLKFKVKSVIQATYDIEDITARQGGFVVHTHLSSVIDNETTINISADSLLVSTYYTIANSIQLRVPNAKLDSTLKEIARNIDFLDYRTIQAEDVSLQILKNTLTQKRIAQNEKRLANAIDNRGKKLAETTSAEELLLNKQEEADNAKINNLSLADRINFSNITLQIYQKQSVKRETVFNDSNITAYTPGFGSRLLESVQQGWNILMDIVFFIVKMWWVILLGILVYGLYKKYGIKFKKNKTD